MLELADGDVTADESIEVSWSVVNCGAGSGVTADDFVGIRHVHRGW